MAERRRPRISDILGQKGGAEPSTSAIRAPASRGDQLEYLGDLVLELQCIADNLGCATLAGLLAVAHKEALIQSRSA